jgi:hypothetical protein
MKTKLSFILLLLFQFTIAQNSTVTIFSEEGERFYVIVNGIRQNDAPGTNVVVTDLDKPNYLFKVIFEDSKLNSINKNIYLEGVDGRVNVTYVLRKNKKGKLEMRTSSFDYDVNKKVDKNTQVVKYHTVENPIENSSSKTTETIDMNTSVMGVGMNTQVNTSEDSMSMNVNIGGIDLNTDVKISETTTITKSNTKPSSVSNQVQTTNLETIENKTNTSNQANVTNKPCVTMSHGSFQSVKSSIQKQSFEDSKMKVAKQILRSNCLNTGQIKEVMNLFSFEESKLNFAKEAYSKCTNKQDYFTISDVFTFSSSSDELMEYIENMED